MINEIEYYHNIFDNFLEHKSNFNKREEWKDHSIIELMNILDEDESELFVQNALIILIALFEDYLRDSFFYRHSENIKNINKNDRKIVKEMLTKEFS